MESERHTLGERWARALAAKDFDAAKALLDPGVDFRALTPKRFWEETDPEAVVTEVLEHWFDESDAVEALERVETGSVADTESVGYRLRVSNPDGSFLVEQHAFLRAREDRIAWIRIVCAGFRPI